MNAFRKSTLSILLVLSASSAVAALEPNRIREALPKKTENYLSEGVVTGGDREIHGGIVKDLRRAPNSGFERIVLDLEAEKAPYYQVAIEPKTKRIVVTVFGSPTLGLNAKKIVESFKRSSLVERVEFFPKIEDDSWVFALYLRAAVPVEVFELTAPSRIIFDLKAAPKFVSALAPKAAVPAKKKAAAVKAIPARPSVPEESAIEGNGAASHSEEIPE